MNKKKIILVTVIIVCLVLLVFELAWIMMRQKPEDMQNDTQPGMQTTAPPESQAASSATEESTAAPEPDATGATEQKPDETEPEKKPGETQKPHNNSEQSSYFPYSIPGSNLVIEQMNSYDGLFFEDGSDEEVTNLTAMVLTNTGDVCAEYIEITIERDGVPLRFIASALEPGGTIIVLETTGKQFLNGIYSNCVAEIATLAEMTMSEDQVRVEENAEGGLLVTNITEEDIPCIRIFYKFYMSDTDVYVGGITYTAKITDLKAGTSCTITPSHYLKGYSKVIMVKTYDTDA